LHTSYHDAAQLPAAVARPYNLPRSLATLEGKVGTAMRWTSVTTALLICFASGYFVAAQEHFEVRDKAEFAKIVPADAKVEKLAGGMTFTEGPCWFDDAKGGYLVFSDIPANQLKRWTAKEGLSVYRDNSNYANGNTRDMEGRLVTCEHQARRVTRTEKDGGISVLADKYEGKSTKGSR
jgi:hypothetical protein